MTEKAEQHGGSLISNQIDRAAASLERAARAIQNSSKNFEGEGYSDLARRAAEWAAKVQGASDYFRESELQDLARDARRLIRQRPILSLLGACTGGFLLARFLKSSAD